MQSTILSVLLLLVFFQDVPRDGWRIRRPDCDLYVQEILRLREALNEATENSAYWAGQAQQQLADRDEWKQSRQKIAELNWCIYELERENVRLRSDLAIQYPEGYNGYEVFKLQLDALLKDRNNCEQMLKQSCFAP